MAELTITLSRDEPSGELEILISYRANKDALPFEHELLHRCLVEQLFPGLEIIDDPKARVRVQREEPAQAPSGGLGGGDFGPVPDLPGGDDFDIEIIDL